VALDVSGAAADMYLAQRLSFGTNLPLQRRTCCKMHTTQQGMVPSDQKHPAHSLALELHSSRQKKVMLPNFVVRILWKQNTGVLIHREIEIEMLHCSGLTQAD